MYVERFNILKKAYKLKKQENDAYNSAVKNISEYSAKASYMVSLNNDIKSLYALISQEEERWQEGILRSLEADIMQCLNIIFPSDGYRVELSTRLLRGKIHIDTVVHSYFSGTIYGEIARSQGRLFQQTVSFASLIAIMRVLGVNTIYVDEAFSGAAVANMPAVNRLVEHVSNTGFNLILIAQNSSIADGLGGNVLRVQRSLDNKTTVTTEV